MLNKASAAEKEPDIGRWVSEPASGIILEAVKSIPLGESIEEIRLRISKPIMIRTDKRDYILPLSALKGSKEHAYTLTKEDLAKTLERMTFSSVYAAEEGFRQGFLTLPGGHRVGIAGEAVVEYGKIKTLKNISALNIRFARQPEIEISELLSCLLNKSGNLCHTLLLSPPRAGKTTALRQLVRAISNGVPKIGLEGQTVGVVDERSEIAGMCQGVPSFDLGLRTDVLDRCPKALGITMLIRAMAPAVLAVDELGGEEDMAAVKDAAHCGVKVLATVHADTVEELKSREQMKELLSANTFERIVVLSRSRGPGTIEGVFDTKTGINLFSLKKNLSYKNSHICS